MLILKKNQADIRAVYKDEEGGRGRLFRAPRNLKYIEGSLLIYVFISWIQSENFAVYLLQVIQFCSKLFSRISESILMKSEWNKMQ